MKHFINFFGCVAALGGNVPFHGALGVRALAAALLSGLADDTQCARRPFPDANSVPVPEGKGLCCCLLSKGTTGSPCGKKYRLIDLTWSALPN